MNVEDRIRTATRDRAGLVRAIRPLELPAAEPRRRPEPGARRWIGWAAPLTAAAVVVAIALALVTARQARNAPVLRPSAPAVSSSANAAAANAAAASAAAAAGVPEYYADLDIAADPLPGHAAGSGNVLVGDVRTGRRLATVSPPPGLTFVGVTAAADDRTFVLAASLPLPADLPTNSPVAWYLLRIAPGRARPATLTRLSIPGQPAGTQVSGIALSPSGRELAVMFQRGVWPASANPRPTGPLTLSVYSVSTGRARRTWTQPTKGFPAGYGWYDGRYSNTSITWLAGGRTLAFTYGIMTGFNGFPLSDVFSGIKIRTLDLTRPSGNLLAASTVVFTPKNHWCMSLQLTTDGKTVICGSYGANFARSSAADDPEITDYSVATGQARLVYRLPGTYALGLASVLWASPSGSVLVGSVYTQTTNGSGNVNAGNAGLISQGALTPLPFPLGPPYVGEVAF